MQEHGNVQKNQRPRPEIRDLLQDFGMSRTQNGSVWCMLDIKKLPSYLRSLRAVKEARKWVAVFSSGGMVRYFQIRNLHKPLLREASA